MSSGLELAGAGLKGLVYHSFDAFVELRHGQRFGHQIRLHDLPDFFGQSVAVEGLDPGGGIDPRWITASCLGLGFAGGSLRRWLGGRSGVLWWRGCAMVFVIAQTSGNQQDLFANG